MGYSTSFTGQIDITPALSKHDAEAINKFAEERHDPDTTPGYYCQWVTTADGSGIEWDGNEKFYDAEKWMAVVINQILQPRGYKCNGTLHAQGEQATDRWGIIVENNKVFTSKATVTYTDRIAVS